MVFLVFTAWLILSQVMISLVQAFFASAGYGFLAGITYAAQAGAHVVFIWIFRSHLPHTYCTGKLHRIAVENSEQEGRNKHRIPPSIFSATAVKQDSAKYQLLQDRPNQARIQEIGRSPGTV